MPGRSAGVSAQIRRSLRARGSALLSATLTQEGVAAQIREQLSRRSSTPAGQHVQTSEAARQNHPLQAYDQALRQHGSLTVRFHPVSRLPGATAPARGQQRHRGGRRRRVAQAQAWRLETGRAAQDTPRKRRGNIGDSGRRCHLLRCPRCAVADGPARPDPGGG